MTRWRDRAEQLCYDGETVRAEVDLDPAGVVVTTHRVLAFTPERAGPNYRAVDRPNVGGASLVVEGSERALTTGVRALVVGGVLLGAGQVLNLEGIVGNVDLDPGATGQVGMGGMVSMLQSLLGLLAVLDDLMTLLGGLALLVVAAALAWYAHSRERLVRLSVAGGDDVVLPAPDDETAVDRLDEALRPDAPDESDGGAGVDGTPTASGDGADGASLEPRADPGSTDDGRPTEPDDGAGA